MVDVLWPLLPSFWGTVRLFQARESVNVKGEENEWGFGQVLAVFLLLGPITTVTLAVFTTFRSRKKTNDQEEDGESVIQAVSLLTAYRTEVTATQRNSNDVMDRVSILLRDIEAGMSINTSTGRRLRPPAELQISLDEPQQFADNTAGTEANGVSNLIASLATRPENNEGIFHRQIKIL
ncbi:hypothetical protein LZ31DRAFT_593421 [Colletotrichum somersetense]|nr:hypothetical protein LZ31DRAFT_593421 [Colletotrichum somersetense]